MSRNAGSKGSTGGLLQTAAHFDSITFSVNLEPYPKRSGRPILRIEGPGPKVTDDRSISDVNNLCEVNHAGW
jgi:hypothetical protein